MHRLHGGALLLVLISCVAPTTEAAVTTTQPPSTTVLPASSDEAVTMFRACMSATGFEPEITVDEDGRPDLSALSGASATDPAFRQAVTLCAGPLSHFLDLDDSPGLQVMIRAQLQNYAGCMRASGVEDFPDPAPDFDGSFAPFPPEQIPTDDPDFPPAVEACAAALGVNGEPSG